MLLVEPNLAFRASSADPDEQLAVRQSFAESVLWGFTVAAEGPGGAVLIDATDFLLHDGHGDYGHADHAEAGSVQGGRAAARRLRWTIPRRFPKNTEVEAELTFTTDAAEPGQFVRDVTPDAHAMTIRERSSFMDLPWAGTIKPRSFNPRAGYFPIALSRLHGSAGRVAGSALHSAIGW